jgi:short-subunit dehydrogenase
VSGRTKERLEAVAAEIREAGGDAFALPADVSRETDITAALAELSKQGQLVAAVFNPSQGERAPSLQLSAAAFEEAMQHRSAWSQELDLRPYKEPF